MGRSRRKQTGLKSSGTEEPKTGRLEEQKPAAKEKKTAAHTSGANNRQPDRQSAAAEDSRPEPKKPTAEDNRPEPKKPTAEDNRPEPKKPTAEDNRPEPKKPTAQDSRSVPQKTGGIKKDLVSKENPPHSRGRTGSEERDGASKSRRRDSGGGFISDQEMRRYIILLFIPLTVILLIVVVLVSGNLKKEPAPVSETAKEAGTVEQQPSHIPVIEPDTKEYIMDFGGSILEQDAVPEINQLMEQYFLSISDCDMDTFLHLFTSRDTSQEAQFREIFEKQREYIESYRNISCYTVRGMDENSYVVYVYYDVKFVGVDTLGPDLVRIYAVRGEDGQFRIFDEQMPPELESYLEQVSLNEDVRLLISQVDNQIAEAMEADGELEKRIAYLKNGPEYMQEEETPQGETPAGETPQGETPAGETPAGETPAGETPAGGAAPQNQPG